MAKNVKLIAVSHIKHGGAIFPPGAELSLPAGVAKVLLDAGDAVAAPTPPEGGKATRAGGDAGGGEPED